MSKSQSLAKQKPKSGRGLDNKLVVFGLVVLIAGYLHNSPIASAECHLKKECHLQECHLLGVMSPHLTLMIAWCGLLCDPKACFSIACYFGCS